MSIASTHSESTTTVANLAAESGSATQRVYRDLRKLIINGDIAPGEKLKVESLKHRLDSGTSPIREALSLLTSDQLVERIDQRGFRAAQASKAHFQEILMLRCQLEDLALRGSIESGDTQWEEKLVLAHHRLTQAKSADAVSWEMHHREFHNALLGGCGSPILLRFCGQLYDLNIRYRFLAGRSMRYDKRDVAQEHQGILEAALARDINLASKRLAEHYRLTGEFLADQFDDKLLP